MLFDIFHNPNPNPVNHASRDNLQNSLQQSAIDKTFAEAKSVFFVFALAIFLPR